MKNKLLKISALALILSASFYFYLNSEQELQKESKREEVKSVDANSKLNVADKKETIVKQPSKTNIQLDLRKSQTVNLSQSIQEEKVQKPSKNELDSIERIRAKYHDLVNNQEEVVVSKIVKSNQALLVKTILSNGQVITKKVIY